MAKQHLINEVSALTEFEGQMLRIQTAIERLQKMVAKNSGGSTPGVTQIQGSQLRQACRDLEALSKS